ncbi:hypothetical protein [Leucothrix pacifica]|uniref:Uncharacterized protein n=1 Tax=Leucothrix pacifica TaxID=1247513 RepID=A0A317CGI9_9GAMM|nr:hypothetical protein [Leucothrix pacifica]PWQ97684.1 hypothetical protein DKW60_09920 [Leucothrix pacifica]
MSAYVLPDEHISYLVSAAIQYQIIQDTPLEINRIGEVLLKENHKSVAYRYREKFDEEERYSFTFYRLETQWPQVLSACKCWNYQACEHPDFKQSEAYELYLRLVFSTISNIPEVNHTHWCIGSDVIEPAGFVIAAGMLELWRVTEVNE